MTAALNANLGATELYALGRSIIPTGIDKKPAVDAWKPFQTTRPTQAEVDQWRRMKPAGWAQITGRLSQIITLDFDGVEGAATLEKLGLSPHRRTPSGGFHVDFVHPGWEVKTLNHVTGKQTHGKAWPGLDIRADGGYVVFTGSTDKGVYEWLRGPEPDSLDILPEALRRDFGLLEPPRAHQATGNGSKGNGVSSRTSRVDAEILIRRALEHAASNGRNNSGMWLACQLRDNGYSEFEADSMMAAYCGRTGSTNTKGQPEPYTLQETRATLKEAYSHPARSPWERRSLQQVAPPVDYQPEMPVATNKRDLWQFPLSEYGDAERLVLLHGQDIRYCHPWGKWLVWDGRRWQLDATAEIMRRAKDTMRRMWHAAAHIKDSNERERAAKHTATGDRRGRLEAMIVLASSEPGIPVLPEQLDANPFLLNLRNGMFCLQTGQLQPHGREHLLTKLAPISYDPAAECPVWLAFQERVTGNNAELVTFKQRAIGYSLTGAAVEKRSLFIFHGRGNNGKTTELELLREMLGEYAGQVRIESLMEQSRSQGNAPSPDIADLRGLRLVVSSEPSEGQRLAENTIKYLTGMGTIKARHLHKENFEFKQTWKFFLDCNTKPVIRGTDGAIWNRIGLVPFEVEIQEHEIDTELPKKLRAEIEGIFAWAVKGCLDWQRFGLKMPEVMQTATAEYRAEMDAIGRFIEECCVVGSYASVRGKQLYSAYKNWREDAGEPVTTATAFGILITGRGFSKDHDNKGVRYDGIGLRVKQSDGCDGL